MYRVPLGSNYDWAGTNSVMTHVLVLSVEVRMDERLWRRWLLLDNGNMCRSTFGFESSHCFQFKE